MKILAVLDYNAAIFAADDYGLTIINGVIQADNAYLNCPFWLIQEPLAHGLQVESLNVFGPKKNAA